MKIKTGDTVRVRIGKDKGKQGKVLQVFVTAERVVVEGLNTRKRHLRASGGKKTGQIVEFPGPIYVSNLQVVGTGLSVGRVGYKFIEKDGKRVKVRVLRKGGRTEDLA